MLYKKNYTQHCGHSAKYFICHRWEGVSKKELELSFTSFLVSCDGQFESSNGAVLAVSGSLNPQASTLGMICTMRSCDSSRGGSCSVNAQLSPSPCSLQTPQWPQESGKVGASFEDVSFEEEEEKESGCVYLLHFCTGSEERYLRAWCIRKKSCCWFLQVPGAAGEGLGAALISDFWQGKLILQSLAPSLAFFSLLSAPTEPPNYFMEENIFLPLPELLIRCLQKIIFRSLQHFPLLHSITLWTHNLVQNENPSEGTSMNFRVNTSPASCRGPN